MNRNRQLSINLIAAAVAFIVNTGINFLLSPYIVESIGVSAYGFWGLANNFVSYASIITIALNSMAGRFFTLEVQKNNWEEANKYFNSIVFANIIAISIFILPATLFVVNINKVINVPMDIALDVRLLFGFIFFSFFVNMGALGFSLAPFAKNIIYLNSLRKIESLLIKTGMLVLLFTFLNPKVWFLGLATITMTLYKTVFGIYYTIKLLPEIHLNINNCRLSAIKELLSSGFWNVVNHIGRLLATGLDLLIANLLIGPEAMGVLALSRTIPMFIESMVSSLASVFSPEFTMLYAQGDSLNLVKSIIRSIKILGIIVNIPIALIMIYGKDFYKLWVPSQNAQLLHILSIIGISAYVFSGATNSIFSIFIVTNKLRTNSLLVLLTGFLNVVIVIFLVKYVGFGLITIAGVSSVLISVRNLSFTVPYGAKYLDLSWKTFFPYVGKSVVGFILITFLGYFIKRVFTIDSWFTLLGVSLLTALIGFILNLMILLNRYERNQIYEIFKRKIDVLKTRP